jgi:hypothetical protein
MRKSMKAGDKGWIMGKGNRVAHPVVIERVVYSSQGDTEIYARFKSGITLALLPSSFLATRKQVEQLMREQIRGWQKALKTFKEDVR